MGIPSIFLRLTGCNLLCKSDSWVCDTIEVWQKGIKTDFNKIFNGGEVALLKSGVHLVITGGEPLLHQTKLVSFIKWFLEVHKFFLIIEIETNGTIIPNPYLRQIVDYWNCSPKLSNSGEPFKKRFKKDAIDVLNKLEGTIFKFVISKTEDVDNMLEEYGKHIDMDKIVLMPAGETREKLNKTRPIVVQQCLNLGFRYSDRLHIVVWDKATGV